METKDCISIIVPCYNVITYVDKCINSLVNQTIGIENLEIILVNDASTDSTYEKLLEWEKKYPDSIVVVNSDINRYIGGARNLGMQYASGEYIGFVDADDFVELEMFATLYYALKEYECDVASVFYQMEDEEGNIFPYEKFDFDLFPCNQKIVIASPLERKRLLLRYGLTPFLPEGIYTKLYRKSFLEKNQFYFPEHLLNEDHFWWALCVYCIESFVIIDKIEYHYIQHSNSITKGRGKENLQKNLDRLTIELLKLEELEKRGILGEYYYECEISFFWLYWIGTLRIFFLRICVCPYDIIEDMKNTVHQIFPKYRENPYVKLLFEHPENQLLMTLLETPLTKQELWEIAKEFSEILTGEDEIELV